MKKAFLIMIAIFYGYGAWCQSKDIFIYDETGIGYGTQFSFQSAINCIFGNDQVATVGYYHTSRLITTPPDYHTGIFTGLPRQKINMLGLMYGKVLYPKNQNVRYVLKGGLAVGEAMTPANFVETDPRASVFLGPNYTYSYHTVFNYGVVLNPAIELPVSRHFGFSFGIFSMINPISSSAGVDANIIFGKLRNKRNAITK